MLEDRKYFEEDPQSSQYRYTPRFDKLLDPTITISSPLEKYTSVNCTARAR